jgi:hypothetical protein
MEGDSISGIPAQQYSKHAILEPVEEGDLKLVVCKIGRLHLGKSKLSASTRRFQNLG